MSLLISALAFIVLLTLLIIIHEFGHFMLAKLFNVDVEEFGFGLPPRAKTLFKAGGTAFTLNWLPFGGFVRLKGENEVSVERRYAEGSFARASAWKRVLILLGGVLMNFLLAFGLLVFGFSYGRWVPSHIIMRMQQAAVANDIDAMQRAAAEGNISLTLGAYISTIMPGSPAEKAGLKEGSRILSINHVAVDRPDAVVELQKGLEEVTYTLKEKKDSPEKDVMIRLEDGKAGIGISPFPAELSAPYRSLPDAVRLAANETVFMTVQTVKGIVGLIKSLVTKAQVPEGIMGFVGIAVITHTTVQTGLLAYLNLVAQLSLSLAILNVLPLPALDGGRLLFVLMEMVLRRPLNQRFELMTNAVGFFVLIGLIVIITFNDVIHLF